MGTSPLTSTAASSSERRGISSEPGIGAPERELGDLKLRGQIADRQMNANQTEPTTTPQTADPIDGDSGPEGAKLVEDTPAATSEPPAVVSAVAPPSPSSDSEVGRGRWIDVDVTQQLLTAYEGSAPMRSVAVSTGLAGTPTPVGQFRIWVKFRYDDMEGPGYYLPDVPYTMYFHGGYGLHGTYWHNNFGHPMSHGCVNLPTPEAEWLFNWAEVGTLVNVHN
jgi:lipoprotein-anchoring transpeptidase ErfK/SrfK